MFRRAILSEEGEGRAALPLGTVEDTQQDSGAVIEEKAKEHYLHLLRGWDGQQLDL